MIIRTQNKKGIVNLYMIDTLEAYDCKVRYFSGGGVETSGTLGTYSTEEKAIKVLDMIAKKYTRYQCLKTSGRLCEEDSIFQMPSDREMEV